MHATKLALISAFLLQSTFALAAGASITSVTGDVKVGREGEWKKAEVGTAIGENDFLTVPAGSKVKVKLPDGKESEFEGKLILPGRRLSSKNSGGLILFTKSVQNATEAVVGKDEKSARAGAGATSGATRDFEVGNEGKLGGRKGGPAFIGEDTSGTRRFSEADAAEEQYNAGKLPEARAKAQEIVASAKAPALEKRRAHLLLGRLAASEAAYGDALKSLDVASAMPSTEEDAFKAENVRATALAQRGQVHLQLGNDARAASDFQAATLAAPESSSAAQAFFFLGTIAASANDIEGAKANFAKLDKFPELKTAGNEILSATTPKPAAKP